MNGENTLLSQHYKKYKRNMKLHNKICPLTYKNHTNVCTRSPFWGWVCWSTLFQWDFVTSSWKLSYLSIKTWSSSILSSGTLLLRYGSRGMILFVPLTATQFTIWCCDSMSTVHNRHMSDLFEEWWLSRQFRDLPRNLNMNDASQGGYVVIYCCCVSDS